ncbi:MAG: hypothetical protein OXH69_14620 [Acidobacteria bacterium]|nr:hypothetical protein [Acidobacteriota bacterium]
MRNRPFAAAVVAAAFLALAALPAAAQSGAAPEPLRTPDGQPDISGIFTFRTLTPLQRPSALEGQETLSLEEAAAFEASERTRLNRDLFDPIAGAPSAGYQPRAEGGVLSYNEFWYERGVELTSDKRTSLVVDPPDGRIPFRPEYQAASRIRRLNNRNGFADSYTDRTLADRCIMGFNAGPPMVSSAYNNNVQILQVPGYVVVFNEMVHNARIIPLDGRPHGDLRQWSGDSRGRWEGETLVVETRNFLRETSLGGSSRDTHVVERFRRVDPDTVLYEFTVEDPNNFTRPWTAMMPLRRTDGTLFEYACHEGNYGLEGILAGARRKNTQRVTEVP